jgi:hypothetical protein
MGKVGTSDFDFEYDSEMYWKTISAVKYRLTRKRIARNGIRMVLSNILLIIIVCFGLLFKRKVSGVMWCGVESKFKLFAYQ